MTFYDNRPVQSYNGILNLTKGARNLGKSTSHKTRSFIRFYKHGRKTEWLRYFRKDVKSMMSKDFYSKKNIQIINDELNRNRKTKIKLTKDNFKQDGKFVYFREDDKHKWRWFISVNPLSDEQAIKSAEDPDTDTIVFDEYAITPEKLARYRGDPVTDFLSIWTTIKRTNAVRAFLLGNKECISDPFSSYFGLPNIDVNFQGIKTFKNGTIVFEQINDVPDEIHNDFDARFEKMLDGTSYGDFLYKGQIRNLDRTRIKPKPRNCTLYCCFDVGRPVSAYMDKYGNIFFQLGIDQSRTIAVDRLTDKYKRAYVINASDKVARFQTLNWAFKMNKVFYASEQAYEQGFKVMKILGIVKGL